MVFDHFFLLLGDGHPGHPSSVLSAVPVGSELVQDSALCHAAPACTISSFSERTVLAGGHQGFGLHALLLVSIRLAKGW